MDIEWSLLLPLLAVLALAVLVTGPGMWSERLGWGWLRKLDRARDRR
jgi:hypothetical protein